MSGVRRWEAAFGRRNLRLSSFRVLLIAVIIVGLNYAFRRNKQALSQHGVAQGPTTAPNEPTPKIALLFLTKGPLPHEPTWRAWFEATSHLLPRNEVQKRCPHNSASMLHELSSQCDGLQPVTSTNAIAAQVPYSVYIHAPPSFTGYPPGSLWDNYLIQERITTRWGDYSLTAATRALISAALVDPGNQWFVLVSESDIPLYDPLTFYLQLMSEQRSRVNACDNGPKLMSHRWSDLMTTSEMNISHWRKSSQWFAMQRRHAEVVDADVEVNESFEKYCKYDMDQLLGRVRDCISDEVITL